MRLVLFFLIIFLTLERALANEAPSLQGGWRVVDEDLEVKELGDGSLFSTGLVFIRSSLKNYKLSVTPTSEFGFKVSSARDIARLSRSQVAINGNFFDPELKALGLVISRGINRGKIHRGGGVLTGIFSITQKGPAIFSRDNYDSSAAIEALQAGPRLLSHGKMIDGLAIKDVVTRRAGICIDTNGRVVIYSSTSNLGGISLLDLQKVLMGEDIGCWDALNLDGGGSAQMYIGGIESKAGVGFEKFIPGMDEVPVFVTLKRSSQ